MLAHLPLAERLALAETFGELVAQRRAAEEHAGRVQIQADEWERSARLCEQDATGWRSKHQALGERVKGLAAEMALIADDSTQSEGMRLMAERLRRATDPHAGDSLPSDGEMVRTEETVKVGGDKL